MDIDIPGQPAGVSCVGDFTNSKPPGFILRGARTVFCGGRPVALHPSSITPHGKGLHSVPITTVGSDTVICEGSPVLYIGAKVSCKHAILTGNTTVTVPGKISIGLPF